MHEPSASDMTFGYNHTKSHLVCVCVHCTEFVVAQLEIEWH